MFPVVCFGEILWDVLPSGPRPGGAPMNVAYHLQKLGAPAALISKVGNDNLGHRLLNILKDNHLTTNYVQTDNIFSTGIVNATIGARNEVSYEIVHPVAWDFISIENGLEDLVRSSSYFVFGSLVARDQHSRYTLFKLVECARKKVVDINLRPPHFQKEVVEHLLSSADMVKMNEHELPLICSWYGNPDNITDGMRMLQDRFSIPVIVVTKGGEGAMVCADGKITEHKGFSVEVADTIGSGDAFLAGFIYSEMKGATINESLKFANSLGAFIASRSGACPAYEPEDLMKN